MVRRASIADLLISEKYEFLGELVERSSGGGQGLGEVAEESARGVLRRAPIVGGVAEGAAGEVFVELQAWRSAALAATRQKAGEQPGQHEELVPGFKLEMKAHPPVSGLQDLSLIHI
jgi:hypothetical protein